MSEMQCQRRRCRISESRAYTDFSPATFYAWRQKGWYPEIFETVNRRTTFINLEKYNQKLENGGFDKPKSERGRRDA